MASKIPEQISKTDSEIAEQGLSVFETERRKNMAFYSDLLKDSETAAAALTPTKTPKTPTSRKRKATGSQEETPGTPMRARKSTRISELPSPVYNDAVPVKKVAARRGGKKADDKKADNKKTDDEIAADEISGPENNFHVQEDVSVSVAVHGITLNMSNNTTFIVPIKDNLLKLVIKDNRANVTIQNLHVPTPVDNKVILAGPQTPQSSSGPIIESPGASSITNPGQKWSDLSSVSTPVFNGLDDAGKVEVIHPDSVLFSHPKATKAHKAQVQDIIDGFLNTGISEDMESLVRPSLVRIINLFYYRVFDIPSYRPKLRKLEKELDKAMDEVMKNPAKAFGNWETRADDLEEAQAMLTLRLGELQNVLSAFKEVGKWSQSDQPDHSTHTEECNQGPDEQ